MPGMSLKCNRLVVKNFLDWGHQKFYILHEHKIMFVDQCKFCKTLFLTVFYKNFKCRKNGKCKYNIRKTEERKVKKDEGLKTFDWFLYEHTLRT